MFIFISNEPTLQLHIFPHLYIFQIPATFPCVVVLKLNPVVCDVLYTDDDSCIAIETSVDQISGETKIVAAIQQCVAMVSYTSNHDLKI